MCSYEKSRDAGVSPVVGVMLMLVVTIIIAAVVSAMAGGMSTGQQKAPTLAAHIEIVNDGGGSRGSSHMTTFVDGVSEPISSKDLKIVTSWIASRDGNVVKGGNTTLPGPENYQQYYDSGGPVMRGMPYGYGSGTNWSKGSDPGPDMMFGNYTILSGTILHTSPYGGKSSSSGGYGAVTKFDYDDGMKYTFGEHCDGMQQALGGYWNATRAGDIVNVKLVHIPSGKVMLDKNVVVKES